MGQTTGNLGIRRGPYATSYEDRIDAGLVHPSEFYFPPILDVHRPGSLAPPDVEYARQTMQNNNPDYTPGRSMDSVGAILSGASGAHSFFGSQPSKIHPRQKGKG